MKDFLTTVCISLSLLGMAACKGNKQEFDATGSFEAEETIVPAEATGVIRQLSIADGQTLQAGQIVGYIDTTQLYLRKKQLEAQYKATGRRLPDISTQTGFYQQQEAVTESRLSSLLHEQDRLQKLVKADAATPKQLDDINAQVDETRKQLLVIKDQRTAQVSALQTQSSSISGDMQPILIQIEQINDQLSKSRIINPSAGSVLTRYAVVNEMATLGKPLYKIADLSVINLRAYITANQLPALRLNQRVTIRTDDGKGGFKQTTGIVSWINDKAEFTPKTIQTKDERANLVYAIKVRVVNDGSYKIGMYGEIKFM